MTSIKPLIPSGIARGVFLIAAAAMLCSAIAETEYLLAARDLDSTITSNYAYLDKLPGGQVPQSEVLTDTQSGGNTTVARAIMGWFVSEPRGYQIHNRPAEERQTGIPRQWVEQVLPRTGRYRPHLPTVLVGRWTGSMGEGLAIGLAALGARVEGTRMAGLLGSVEDLQVGQTDLFIKLPTERLFSVTGSPREAFVPKALADYAGRFELKRLGFSEALGCEDEPR